LASSGVVPSGWSVARELTSKAKADDFQEKSAFGSQSWLGNSIVTRVISITKDGDFEHSAAKPHRAISADTNSRLRGRMTASGLNLPPRKTGKEELGPLMEDTHQYRVVAWWASGRTGTARSDSAPNAIHFTAPPQFGGVEGRWTPEDLLLSAVASCYTTTFRALAERSRFDYADLEVEVQGTIHRADSGYHFSEIIMHPNLTISGEEGRDRALVLLQKAEALCLVSRALSITQTFEPRIQLGKPLHAR